MLFFQFDVSQLSGKTVLLQGSQDFTVKQDQEVGYFSAFL